ncbi:MAG: tRNA (cytidine(34)-2'-O)-methyltransferase [Spirochaetota bacterium]
MLNIVLYRPEIPPNTGNIARLCVNAGISLHIVGEPSFDLSEKAVRRAGLDYWKFLSLSRHKSWDNFMQTVSKQQGRAFLITKFASKSYTKQNFCEGDFLVFGRETSGVPPEVAQTFSAEYKLSIPMKENSRSLNLSNAVAILAYEALRQIENW